MDQEGSSSFYVIDKQTSSHIVWRCTFKSCSGRLKVDRKDNKVISSKPHNHDVVPGSAAASNELEKICCVKMNKYVVIAAVAIALMIGALIGGLVGHYGTLYKIGYYEDSYNKDKLSSMMAMMNGNNNMAHDGINNFNSHDLINQEDIPQETFSNDLVNQDNRFHNTHHQNVLQQNNRNSLESVNTNFNSLNTQFNLDNNHNFHNQGFDNIDNNAVHNSGVDPRSPNEFQQDTNSNAIQNQVNQFLNEENTLQGNIGNVGVHRFMPNRAIQNLGDHNQNQHFQPNTGIPNQGDHNQHQQNVQQNIHLQNQQNQPFNQNNLHVTANHNIHQGHQGQHIHGQTVNHGPNQHPPRNGNTQNFSEQQSFPTNIEEMETISTSPTFQSSFTLQSMSMIKEEDNASISTTNTSKTPNSTQATGIPLPIFNPSLPPNTESNIGLENKSTQNSLQTKDQTSLNGAEMGHISIVKVASVPINLEGLTTFNEGSISKSLNVFPTNKADITTETEKLMVQTPVILENKDMSDSSDLQKIMDLTGIATESHQDKMKMTVELNHNLSENQAEIISNPIHPIIDFPNLKTTETETEKSGQVSDINIEGVNVNDGFPIRNDPNPAIELPSLKLNDAISLSVNKELNHNTDTALINEEGISMVSEGLSMAMEGLSMIDHDVDPQNIDLKHKIDNMQDAIANINILPSLNISHKFSLDTLPNSHVNEDISLSFVKSQPTLPTSPINNTTTLLEKKSLLLSKMPQQLIPTPISHSAQGLNIEQLVSSPVSPPIQGANNKNLVPTPVSSQTLGTNNKQLIPTPLSPLTQGTNNKQLIPTPFSPATEGTNNKQLIPIPLSLPTQGTNNKQLIPTPLLPATEGTNNKQLIPIPLSPPTQGTNNKQLIPTPLSIATQGTNNKQLIPTPLSPPTQGTNNKQLIPTPLLPGTQGTNTNQLVPTPVSPPIQESNTKKLDLNPVSPPLEGSPKLVPTPISSPNIEVSPQLNPAQEHQAAQQQPIISNIQENVRSKSAHGIHSENPNRSNSVSFSLEEIKNYILKSVSTENLRNNLKELSRLPHQAGSTRERQLANLIKERFLSSGFDMAELVPYDVLLSKPDPAHNNRVSLNTEGGVGEEVWAAQSVILPNEDLQAYSAYSPSGKVMTSKGEAVVYVNYGQDEDFKYLDSIGVSVSGRVVMARTINYVSGMKVVQRAVSRGARGVIFYADPAEAVNFGDTTVYPNSTSLPGDAVPLRAIRSGQGDPLTPGWPSKTYSHRLLEENLKSLPTIPVQPISYNDARVILQKLGGPASPAPWHGDLTDVSYNIGPTMTSDFAHLNLCLATYNQLNRTTIYNVIGTIKGQEEPDRYVILGNHRDAWAYGAIDPSSGTSQMLETASVLGQLKAKGWRPRRTLVFASWGAEEFGKIGSTEWVEEHVGKLQERGVAYINVDICSTGPILAHSASPTLRDVLVDMAKVVPGVGSGGTIYDEWREYSLRVDKTEPKPWHLGTGTDFAAFSFFGGIPSLGMGFMRNSTRNDVPMYPAYHTAIETFHLVETFIDPGFNIHQGCSRLSALTLARLAESPVLPLDPHYLAVTMEEALTEMTRKGLPDVLMGTLGVQTLPALGYSITSFKMAANAFLTRIRNPNYYKDPMILRGVNDQLTRLEQNFLMPQGSEDKPWCRQAVFAPSPGSAFGKWGFPALKDLLVGLENLHGTELTARHHLIEKHVSDLILMTNSAISSLNHLHVI